MRRGIGCSMLLCLGSVMGLSLTCLLLLLRLQISSAQIKQLHQSKQNIIQFYRNKKQQLKFKVKFQYEEDENYNSKAMEFLNYIVQITNLEVPQSRMFQNKENKSLQQIPDEKKLVMKKCFDIDTEKFFKLIEDQQTLLRLHEFQPKFPQNYQLQRSKDKSIKTEGQKQKYRQKVKEYTSYLIGKKLGEDNKPFTQFQIESGKLQLRNSAMMRVMTKWCEELNDYFVEKNILDREVPFRMENGQEKFLQQQATVYLSYLLQQKKQQIENKLKQVINNNYFHQFSCINKETNTGLLKFSEDEAMVGQFTEFVFKNNKSYLIIYFNLLVHGLKRACRNFSYFIQSGGYEKHRENYLKEQYEFLYQTVLDEVKNLLSKFKYLPEETPQLVTCRIGDLLRCKCSSKQNEIMALYKQIQRVNRFHPVVFKIIRMKNRLNSGNKDILMNILYKNTMVVEMQLAIKQQKSKFTECSNKFNHYFYEMKRAKFGAIMEMCSIWMSQDSRAQFYQTKIQKLTQKKQEQCYKELQKQKKPCCLKQKIQFNYLPFVCRLCSRHYSLSLMSSHHITCLKCSQYTCFYCEFSQRQTWKEKIKILPSLKHIEKYSHNNFEIIKEINDHVGYGGLMITQSSKRKTPIRFIPFPNRKKTGYKWQILSYDNDQLKIICELKSDKIPLNFLKQNIFCNSDEIHDESRRWIRQNNIGQLAGNFLRSKVIQQKTKTQKNSISMVDEYIETELLTTMKNKSWNKVKRINLSGNGLNFNEDLVNMFPNVDLALLNKIQTSSIPNNVWKNITNMHLRSNNIVDIEPLSRCYKLRVLDLSVNQINVVPASIKCLKQLRRLYLSSNKIEKVAEQFSALVNLNTLAIDNNIELEFLPQAFAGMKEFQIVSFGQIGVKYLPKTLFVNNTINSLKISAMPKLETIPETLGGVIKLQNIRELKLQQLKPMQDIPNAFQNFVFLKKLQICSNNNLKKLPDSLGTLSALEQLEISSNAVLVSLPDVLDGLRSLKTFTIENNSSLASLPNSLGQIKSLQKLIITKNNELISLPEMLNGLQSLQVLKFNENPKVKTLPESLNSLAQLQQLELLKNQQMVNFPESFNQLKSLQKLKVQSSKLLKSFSSLSSLQQLTIKQTKYSNEIDEVLSNFAQLRHLQLYCIYQMENLPKTVCSMARLQKLIIMFCPALKDLPLQLGQLKCLTILQIVGCQQLQTLPDVFHGMDCMQQRVISNNDKLLSLPQSIGSLSSLKKLTVSFNDQLYTAPESLRNLTQLSQLHVYYNQYLENIWIDFQNLKQLRKMTIAQRFCPSNPKLLLPNCKIKTMSI